MKNKVFKYIKVFISVALILSLVAPSYASLSASDGSAFVTKAEFDSALADFNSRLTTFEAGINSKIDSQVTSYLDRNGIWNGEEQELVISDNKIDMKSSFGGDASCNIFNFLGKANGKCKYSGAGVWDVESLTVTKPFNKSGLCAIDAEFYHEKNGTGYDFIHTSSISMGTVVKGSDEWTVVAGYQWQITETGSTPVYGAGVIGYEKLYQIGGKTSNFTTVKSASLGNFMPIESRKMIFGFCSKGTQELRLVVFGNVTNLNKNFTVSHSLTENYTWNTFMKLHEVKIY